ncbi:rubrerythrin-like domain-containing protein [Natrinema soli]|uniref:Rubrerythrin-like domain-containing protein n=1 Tax=Natrinema soli TaxID=1930624 RepID=A0ABD5SX01_9EURY|nr:rubrerythrin-like domain-containing protein [Natrinema soli]
MTLEEQREYVCVHCGRRETVGDTLLSTCQQCGGEMRNVELIRE